MPEETNQPPAGLPPPEPALDGGNRPADPAFEIPDDILRRIEQITVTHSEIRRLAAKDKCLTKLLSKLREAETVALPSRAEIEAQKKVVQMEYQRLCQLQSRRQKRRMTVDAVTARVRQRLATLAEREEARKVRAIQGRISPRFRPGAPAPAPPTEK